MLLRQIRRAVFCLALALPEQLGVVRAQGGPHQQHSAERTYRVVRPETYDRVLDVLFPRDDPDPGKTIFSFTLRFKPNNGPESQIVITRGVDKVEAIVYTPDEGAVYSRLNAALARGAREDAEQMAKAFKAKRSPVGVTLAQVRKWQASFFDSLAVTNSRLREMGSEFDRSGHESVLSHGAEYELWYSQSLNQMSFSLYDVELNDARSGAMFRLVQWMSAVRRDVEKLK